MARINTVQLIDNATNLGDRARKVQQDPAVRKAGTQMALDARQAYTSAAAFASEVSASWRRNGPAAAAAAPAGLYA